MFLIRLNHLIAVLAIFETTALTQQNAKHPFMAASWGYKHFCHFVRYFEFNFFLDLVEAPTFFSTGVVSAKVLLQVVSVATLTAISYFHFVHFLSCSTFMCFLGYSCHNTNARHHDRSSGRQ